MRPRSRIQTTGQNNGHQLWDYSKSSNRSENRPLIYIAAKYNLDLDGEWNKDILPHQGRHPNVYHEWVLEQMRIIDNMPNMNQQEFIRQFNIKVKQHIRNNPEMLYKNYWE